VGTRLSPPTRTGANNAAYGYIALLNNTESFNTAFGSQALVYNTTGFHNTATGYQALVFNTIGDNNTATGTYALQQNSQGYGNTTCGYGALEANTMDFYNTAVGFHAGSLATANFNIAIGAGAGANLTTGISNIDIDNIGVAGESGTIPIGRNEFHSATYLAGIAGQTVGAGGSTCYVENDGKLGVFLSARRFKTDIADMNSVSEAVLHLRPVTFRYKPELKATNAAQFGLIAEEVAEVDPNLVTHDATGKLSTVRYEAVNAMLLNEFLKEHRKVQEQEATIALLKSTDAKQEAIIAKQQKQIEALTAGLQKVNAQLELRKAEQEVAVNSP
jgi:uncharacterized coiled-coil protein SlyX